MVMAVSEDGNSTPNIEVVSRTSSSVDFKHRRRLPRIPKYHDRLDPQSRVQDDRA
jgi:hypothetical protein